MKNKRSAALIVFFLVLSAILGGCNASMKTAGVATKFGEAMKQQPITSATAEVSCDVTANVSGEVTSSKFRTVVHSKTDWAQNRSYSDVETTMTLLDVDMIYNMQCYTSSESGEAVRYLHVDNMDTWFRLDNQKRIVDVDPALIMQLLEKVAQETTLETRENSASGSQQYVLSLCFQGQDLIDFARAANLTIPSELDQYDFGGVSVPVELVIEDKTFLPIRLLIQVKGVSSPGMSALIKSFAEAQGITADIQMGDITLLLTNFGYGPQDVPMLPMGTAETALDMKKIREMQN